MPYITLSDKSYEIARRRAAESGFASVEEYVVHLLQTQIDEENLDHLFTPERLAHIDRAASEIDAGLGITLEEFDVHFAKLKDQWLRRNK